MQTEQSAVDDLYAAPLEKFISRRNDLAKELAAAGDKQRAAEVKKLTKPSAPAWTLNQLVRRDPAGIESLLAGGEALRGVQRGGTGDLRSLQADVRKQVTKLLSEAQSIMEAGGRQATQAMKNRVMQSLMAAAAQEEAGARLKAGRLSQELEAGGFDAVEGDLLASSVAAPPSPRRKEAESRAQVLAEEADAAEAEAAALAKAADHADRAAQRARVQAEKAATAARSKRAKADSAIAALDEGA